MSPTHIPIGSHDWAATVDGVWWRSRHSFYGSGHVEARRTPANMWETMPGDGFARVDDKYCAYPEIQVIKDYHKATRGILSEISLQTPTGERVPGHDIQWELNPYVMVCGDNSGLMGIVPDHHHFWASTTATTLCTLVETDFRSQFYKTFPTRESSPTSQPEWSPGNGKFINRH